MSADRGPEDTLLRIGSAIASRGSMADKVMSEIEASPVASSHGRRRRGVLPARPGLWRRVAQPRWIAGVAAAAAVVLIGAGLGWHFLLGSGVPLTLAQVVEAVETQSWVHLKYSNGVEWWHCLQDGRDVRKEPTGIIWYANAAEGTFCTYYPSRESARPRTDVPGVIVEQRRLPSDSPILHETAWELVVGGVERSARSADRGDSQHQIEIQKDFLDGREVIRFDAYHTDLLGDRRLQWQLWADPGSRLPVMMRMRPLSHWPSPQPEFVSGDYSFPANGPADLYALGVPREAEVVVQTTSLGHDLQALKLALEQADERLPTRYRHVVWDSSHVMIKYRRGWQSRLEYFTYEDPAKQDEDFFPATVEDAIGWSRDLVQYQLNVVDGQRMYNVFRPIKHSTRQKPYLRVSSCPHRVDQVPPTDLGSRLRPRPQWSTAELLAANEDTPPGCVGVRSKANPLVDTTAREDLYYDPDRDYICVRRVSWQEHEGQWRKQAIVDAGSFYQLGDGQWCCHRLSTVWQASGIDRPGTDRRLDVRALADDEFPVEVFNGQKLLEQAKAEGMEINAE